MRSYEYQAKLTLNLDFKKTALTVSLKWFLVPRPPRSAVARHYWIWVHPSVRLSVNFSGGFLFRDRTPKLLDRIEWNFLQWKNIYWSCAPGYWFCRATKIGVVRLGQKWGISTQWSLQWRTIYWRCAPGYWFCRHTTIYIKNVLRYRFHLIICEKSPIYELYTWISLQT